MQSFVLNGAVGLGKHWPAPHPPPVVDPPLQASTSVDQLGFGKDGEGWLGAQVPVAYAGRALGLWEAGGTSWELRTVVVPVTPRNSGVQTDPLESTLMKNADAELQSVVVSHQNCRVGH